MEKSLERWMVRAKDQGASEGAMDQGASEGVMDGTSDGSLSNRRSD